MSTKTLSTPKSTTKYPDTCEGNIHDADLKRRVTNFLFERHHHALRTVDVDVTGGSVVLHGRVNTFYEKQLCLSCCQRVAGVIRLVDEIEVV